MLVVHRSVHVEKKRENENPWDDGLDDDTFGTVDLCEYIRLKFVPVRIYH